MPKQNFFFFTLHFEPALLFYIYKATCPKVPSVLFVLYVHLGVNILDKGASRRF